MQCGLVYYSSFGTGAWTINTLLLYCCTEVENGWFSWGVASLPEGKSWGLCLVQLWAKYKLVSASPYHCCLKIEEADSHKLPLDHALALQK